MDRKIDIFVDGKYEATTTQSKTCKEAVDRYVEKYKPEGKVSASFQNSKENSMEGLSRQERANAYKSKFNAGDEYRITTVSDSYGDIAFVIKRGSQTISKQYKDSDDAKAELEEIKRRGGA